MEAKLEVLMRLPPGDRWIEPTGDGKIVFPSLTAGLEYIYQKTYNKQFYIDAGEGKVYILKQEADPEPEQPKFSIYGDY